MRRTFRLAAATLLALCLLAAPALARDWNADPASIEIERAPVVAAIGDVHGAFDEFAASLAAVGMAERPLADSFKLKWTGGTAVLVLTGDLNDRGTHTRECYDAVMDLEAQAAAAGGRVVALLGNHETLLLNGTVEKWAATLKPPKKQHYQNTLDSFARGGYDFRQAISKSGRYGAWIRRRPLFAVVNGFLFVHGGLPRACFDRKTLVEQFKALVESDNWSSGPLHDEGNVLWHRGWWDDAEFCTAALAALGARGVVFGHTVGAAGVEGEINARDNRLVGIDVGMTPVYGKCKGGGLLIEKRGDELVFTARYADRPAKELFRLPAAR